MKSLFMSLAILLTAKVYGGTAVTVSESDGRKALATLIDQSINIKIRRGSELLELNSWLAEVLLDRKSKVYQTCSVGQIDKRQILICYLSQSTTIGKGKNELIYSFEAKYDGKKLQILSLIDTDFSAAEAEEG